jgi:hypothetical protein
MIHTLKWKEEVLNEIKEALKQKEFSQTTNELAPSLNEPPTPLSQPTQILNKNKLNMANAC